MRVNHIHTIISYIAITTAVYAVEMRKERLVNNVAIDPLHLHFFDCKISGCNRKSAILKDNIVHEQMKDIICIWYYLYNTGYVC